MALACPGRMLDRRPGRCRGSADQAGIAARRCATSTAGRRRRHDPAQGCRRICNDHRRSEVAKDFAGKQTPLRRQPALSDRTAPGACSSSGVISGTGAGLDARQHHRQRGCVGHSRVTFMMFSGGRSLPLRCNAVTGACAVVEPTKSSSPAEHQRRLNPRTGGIPTPAAACASTGADRQRRRRTAASS